MPYDRKALEAMDDAQLDALEQELTGKVMRSRQKPGWGEKEWWKGQEREKKQQQKLQEPIQKDIIGAQQRMSGTKRFMQQYERSINELREFDPKIDEEGWTGYFRRKGAGIAEFFDELPETSALNTRIKPMANKMARDIEGGRVTDSDRKIYADAFANGLLNPSTTNIRLMAENLIDLADLGGNEKGRITEHLKELMTSGNDTMQGVVGEVLEQFPELVREVLGEDYEVVQE